MEMLITQSQVWFISNQNNPSCSDWRTRGVIYDNRKFWGEGTMWISLD